MIISLVIERERAAAKGENEAFGRCNVCFGKSYERIVALGNKSSISQDLSVLCFQN
jgi:hypothetical protein